MSTQAQRVLDEALALSDEDRSVLALLLLDSLGERGEDVEQAWRREVATRLGEVRTGQISLVPWQEARTRIFAR
jgi:putative addiction module component (TIGR02574 family)